MACQLSVGLVNDRVPEERKCKHQFKQTSTDNTSLRQEADAYAMDLLKTYDDWKALGKGGPSDLTLHHATARPTL